MNISRYCARALLQSRYVRLLNPIKAVHLPDFTWKIDQRLSVSLSEARRKIRTLRRIMFIRWSNIILYHQREICYSPLHPAVSFLWFMLRFPTRGERVISRHHFPRNNNKFANLSWPNFATRDRISEFFEDALKNGRIRGGGAPLPLNGVVWRMNISRRRGWIRCGLTARNHRARPWDKPSSTENEEVSSRKSVKGESDDMSYADPP